MAAKAVRRSGGAAAETLNTVESPSAQVVKSAQKEVVVTDDLGRQLTIRRFGALQRFDLIDILGSTTQNQMLMGQAATAVSVVKIDGDAVRFPGSKSELRKLVDRLGNEGMAAADAGLMQLLGIEVDQETGEVSTADARERAKNSQATPTS